MKIMLYIAALVLLTMAGFPAPLVVGCAIIGFIIMMFLIDASATPQDFPKVRQPQPLSKQWRERWRSLYQPRA